MAMIAFNSLPICCQEIVVRRNLFAAKVVTAVGRLIQSPPPPPSESLANRRKAFFIRYLWRFESL